MSNTTDPAPYRVLLLPSHQIAASGLSLREAALWIATYNRAMAGSGHRAVIDQAEPAQAARRAA